MIAPAVGAGRRARGRPRAPRLLPLLAVLVALGGCQSPQAPGGGNVEAKLVGTTGSVANGSAVLHDARSGVDIAVWLGGIAPGRYRVVIHASGNCSSPNAFSAGSPWAPPGVPLAVVVVDLGDDTRTVTEHLAGYRVQGPDGVTGRSVVVHAGGSGSLEAQPGVPNNRVACGVIGTPESILPRLGL